MINLFYPFIGGVIVFGVTVIFYKAIKKGTKYSLVVGLILMFFYWLFMIPNTLTSYSEIKDKSGLKCVVGINSLYEEFNILNRYNPFFSLSSNITNPDKCENLDFCYWNSATFEHFKECMNTKEYLNQTMTLKKYRSHK